MCVAIKEAVEKAQATSDPALFPSIAKWLDLSEYDVKNVLGYEEREDDGDPYLVFFFENLSGGLESVMNFGGWSVLNF